MKKDLPDQIYEECKKILANYHKYGNSHMQKEYDDIVTIERQDSDEYVFPDEIINRIEQDPAINRYEQDPSRNLTSNSQSRLSIGS